MINPNWPVPSDYDPIAERYGCCGSRKCRCAEEAEAITKADAATTGHDWNAWGLGVYDGEEFVAGCGNARTAAEVAMRLSASGKGKREARLIATLVDAMTFLDQDSWIWREVVATLESVGCDWRAELAAEKDTE